MTLAGKKLQDIYDSGANTLAELEEQAVIQFKQDKDEHTKDLKKSAEKSSQALDDKFELLQGEFKQSIDESLKKMQDALAMEHNQNQAFALNLVSELKAVAQQMKLKLTALRQTHHENVDFAFTFASEKYLSRTEEARLYLEQMAMQSMQGLSVRGKSMWDSLQQTTEQVLQKVQEEINKSNDTFFSDSNKQKDVITTHAGTIVQTLSADCQNKLKVLEASVREVNQGVEASARSLLETINVHASTIEKQIDDQYSETSDSYFQQADVRLGTFADELSAMHDNTIQQLANIADELSSSLVSGSSQVQNDLRFRCEEIVRNVSKLFADFKERLDERLRYNQEQKVALENDKNAILTAVQNELITIQNAFEKKITGLLTEIKAEILSMTESIESQMMSTMESYGAQMSTGAMSIQRQIDSDIAGFLKHLLNTQNEAIKEIAEAAEGEKNLFANEPAQEYMQDIESPLEVSENLEVDDQIQDPGHKDT